MTHTQKNNLNFYLKPFLWSWGISIIVYSFMLFQFWWGNHDWDLLKQGVNFSSGLFEARFTQFIIPVVFLDGHTLPVICIILSLGLLCATGILSGYYLELPKKFFMYLIFSLFVVLNPHNFVLFYYVYLIIPFSCWAILSILILILHQRTHNLQGFAFGVIGLLLILGGYPPIISFICTMFMAKQIIEYLQKKGSFNSILKNISIFIGQLALSAVFWKICCFIIRQQNLLRKNWYNLNISKFTDIINNILTGWLKAVKDLFLPFPFLEETYYLPLAIITISALIIVYNRQGGKKLGIFLLEIGMLVASQTIFIVAEEAEQASLRLLYWSRLGLYLFAISILFNTSYQFAKNIITLLICYILFSCTNINFNIMKNEYLGFKGGNRLYARILNAIEQKPSFDPHKEYITMIFGQPNFRIKYYGKSANGQSGELLEKAYAFGINIGSILFFDTDYNPVVVGVDVQANRTMLRMSQNGSPRIMDNKFFTTSLYKYSAMKLWLYSAAKIGSGDNSVFVGDKYIIVALHASEFYKNRELVIDHIKKWSEGKR